MEMGHIFDNFSLGTLLRDDARSFSYLKMDSVQSRRNILLTMCIWLCVLRILHLFSFVRTARQTSRIFIAQHFSFLFSVVSAGAIFEQGTDEVQSAFKFAMLNHNLNVTSRRFELQAYVDVINTADAFKLSRLSK